MKRSVLITFGIFIILGAIWLGSIIKEYATFWGEPSFKLSKQQTIASSINFNSGSLFVEADKTEYDKFETGYFKIVNTSNEKFDFTEEWNVQHFKDGKWYDIIHDGLGFSKNTSTLSKEQITDMLAMGNYKVGKFRYVKTLTGEDGKQYSIGVPFELKWFWR